MADPPKAPSGGTVTIAGKKFPKTYVYAGAAATVGIVAYAYWNRARSEETAEPLFDEFGNPIAGGAPLSTPPTVTNSNGTFNPDPDQDVRPMNNVAWGIRATEFLTNQGYEGIVVAPALGKFLARMPLNAAERAIVQAAIAGAGWPPENGPWTIIDETTPIAVGVTAPKNARVVSANDTSITFAWDSVPGATKYRIEGVQGVDSTFRTAETSSTQYTLTGLRPAHPYRLDIRAVDAQSKTSDETRIVGRTTSPVKITTAPNVQVVGSTRTSVHFRWPAVNGASGYIVEGIEGVSTVKLKRLIPNREFVWQGRRPGHSYRLRVRGAQSAQNIGPPGTAVGRTKP